MGSSIIIIRVRNASTSTRNIKHSCIFRTYYFFCRTGRYPKQHLYACIGWYCGKLYQCGEYLFRLQHVLYGRSCTDPSKQRELCYAAGMERRRELGLQLYRIHTCICCRYRSEPDPANPDSWAMHGRGVQITDNASDINGNPRPTTLTTGVPDLGAYEFLPTVLPPVLPATPAVAAPGTTQRFMFGTDTVQKITWTPASTVPTTVEVRRYSGVIPPGLATGQLSMYFYADVDITGTQPSSYTMQQYYIDSWLRYPIGADSKTWENRCTAAWQIASGSTVDFFGNVITENNLSFLDKFTGMTDGSAAPPPPPILTLDTSNRGRRFWVGYGHHYGFSTNGQDMVLYLSAEHSANVQ